MARMTRPCAHCGNSFAPSKPTQRSCSRPCGQFLRYCGRTPSRAVRTGRQCEVCAAVYRATYGDQRTCGPPCGRLLAAQNRQPKAGKIDACRVWIKDCAECSSPFVGRSSTASVCSETCRTYRARRWYRDHYDTNRHRYLAHAHARRSRLSAVDAEPVVAELVYQRDRWRCAICRKKVRRKPRYKYDPEMASLDHVLPVVEGGAHSYANVRCTHLRCNLARRDRGGNEQLALC